jgi:hypothetical protein
VENGSWEAVDGETTRSVLEDDGGSLWCSSGSGNGFGDGGVDGGPSFKRQLDSGGLDSAGRRHKLGRLWRLGLGQNSHWEHAIYRGKSHELVAEADSSQSFLKILTNHEDQSWIRRGERIRFGDELSTRSVTGVRPVTGR